MAEIKRQHIINQSFVNNTLQKHQGYLGLRADVDALQKKLLSLEALASALIQESYEARKMLQTEEVSTSSNPQLLTPTQLAAISAKRSARLEKIKIRKR
jgi:hypothetical protein